MTSKLKCPICGGDIQYNDSYSTYDCKNSPAIHNASKEIWQALIQAKQDLEIAQQALKVYSSDSGNWWYGYEFHGRYEDYAGEYADKALEQLDHFADVSKMVGQN